MNLRRTQSLATLATLAVALGWVGPARAADEPTPATPVAPADPAAQEPAAGEGAAPSGAAEEPPPPEEVSILGQRPTQTSGSVHQLKTKELERFEHDDPHAILLAVPGVYVRGEDGFGLRPNIGMRGAISDRSKKLTLMEDGVLFGPAPYSAPAAYYFPVMTRMASVRVVKGPSSVVYGPHTVAGAIDLVTAGVPDGEHALVDLAIGQYLSRKAHARLSTSGDHFGVLVEGVHLANDGFKTIDGDDGANTGFERSETMAKVRYSTADDAGLLHELELKLGFASEVSHETYLGLTEDDFEADPYRRYASTALDRMEWTRTQLALSHTLRRGRDVEVVSTLYRNDLSRVWTRFQGLRGAEVAEVLRDPDSPRNALFYGVLTGAQPRSTDAEDLIVGPNDRTFVSQGFQSRTRWQPTTGPVAHKLEFGARIHYDSIARLHERSAYALEGGAMTRLGSEVLLEADNEADTHVLALWAMDAATWGPVTLTAGARVESIQGRYRDALTGREEGQVQQVVLPGGGVFVALPVDGLGVLAGLNQGFSPVPPGQGTLPVPEKSLNAEYGARYAPSRALRVEAIGFYNAYSNLANVCTFSTGCTSDGTDRQFNAGRARVLGLELEAEVERTLADDLALSGRAAYTLTDARFSDDFESADPIFGAVRAGDRLPYVPVHQASASVGVDWAWSSVGIGGTYVGAMREVAGQGTPGPGEATDAYFLLDGSIKGRPVDHVELYLTGKNLLDSVYLVSRRPFGARPGAPLWLQAGVKVDY